MFSSGHMYLLCLLFYLFCSLFFPQLVNYTANLTEERDELNASLEEAKKALQREMATRIALESKGQMRGRKVRRTAQQHISQHVCTSGHVVLRARIPKRVPSKF